MIKVSRKYFLRIMNASPQVLRDLPKKEGCQNRSDWYDLRNGESWTNSHRSRQIELHVGGLEETTQCKAAPSQSANPPDLLPG